MNKIGFKFEHQHLHRLFSVDELQVIEDYQRKAAQHKNIRFSTHGVSRLMTLDELQRLPRIDRLDIRVVDIQTGASWKTNYRTIVRKFG